MNVLVYILVAALVTSLLVPREYYSRAVKISELTRDIKASNTSFTNNELSKNIALLCKLGLPIMNLVGVPFPDSLLKNYKKKIKLANIQTYISLEEFISIKYGTMILVTIFFSVIFIGDYTIFNSVIIATMSVVGLFLPDNILNQKVESFQNALEVDIPNFLTSLSVVVDAGLDANTGLRKIVESHEGALSRLVKSALDDVKIGLSYRDSFERLLGCSNLEDYHRFINLIIITNERGTDGFAKQINELADDCWKERKANVQSLVNKASSKLFIPMILFVFPSVMIVILGPLIFSVFEVFK